ncbi:MAG: hypothetical protein EXS16_21200 [Gemmataceae bacterium]|nr:hypothetical protein [Gemmataceae bacterium]
MVQTTTTTSTTDPLDLSQPGFGDKGQVIAVTVTPSDSLNAGTAMTTSTTVVNSAPVIGSLAFDNTAPKTNNLLTVQANDVSDPDGNAITYTYVWSVAGIPVQTTTTTSATDSLDLSQPGFGDKGELIEVTVVPDDFSQSGISRSISTFVVNSAPVLSNVEDLDFSAGEAVLYQFLATDADGDAIYFQSYDLPSGLTLDLVSGIISGISPEGTEGEPVSISTLNINVSDGLATGSQPYLVSWWNITCTSAFITAPPGWNGTVNPLGTTFTLTIAGNGASPDGDRVVWSIWDEDLAGFDPDDELIDDTNEVAVGAGANGDWTMTKTFVLFKTSWNSVAGADGSSWESEAEVFAHIEKGGGRDMFETLITIVRTAP